MIARWKNDPNFQLHLEYIACHTSICICQDRSIEIVFRMLALFLKYNTSISRCLLCLIWNTRLELLTLILVFKFLVWLYLHFWWTSQKNSTSSDSLEYDRVTFLTFRNFLTEYRHTFLIQNNYSYSFKPNLISLISV